MIYSFIISFTIIIYQFIINNYYSFILYSFIIILLFNLFRNHALRCHWEVTCDTRANMNLFAHYDCHHFFRHSGSSSLSLISFFLLLPSSFFFLSFLSIVSANSFHTTPPLRPYLIKRRTRNTEKMNKIIIMKCEYKCRHTTSFFLSFFLSFWLASILSSWESFFCFYLDAWEWKKPLIIDRGP